MWTIRTGTAADLPTVVELWNREAGPTSIASGVPEATALLRHDPDALLVAIAQSTIIGTLIVGWDGWRCHLYRLAVEPRHRRQGVGRALVAEAGRRAAGRGARRLDALVSLENRTAIAFWEEQGFDRDAADGRFWLVL